MSWQNNGGNNGGGGDRNPWGRPPGGSGGGGRGGPPPDLDDIIRKGQDQLKSLLPGGGGGAFTAMILIFLGIIVFMASSYTVQPGQEAVILRFGESVRSEGPGFHLKLPSPIETVIKADIGRQNRLDIGFRTEGQSGRNRTRGASLAEESLMLTGDENIIDIAFTVFWRIDVDKAEDFLFNVEAPQAVTVKAVAESAMREVIGRTEIEFALTQGRDQIQQAVQEIIQRTLDEYGAGISITEINLERVDPPSQVIDAFRDVQAAEADRDRLRNEARAYADSIVPEARGNAARMRQEAEAYKEQVIARATGEASRFMAVYGEYAQAKNVTRTRIYLETMEEIYSGMNKIILDDQSSGVVPYLPLSELQKKPASKGDKQ